MYLNPVACQQILVTKKRRCFSSCVSVPSLQFWFTLQASRTAKPSTKTVKYSYEKLQLNHEALPHKTNAWFKSVWSSRLQFKELDELVVFVFVPNYFDGFIWKFQNIVFLCSFITHFLCLSLELLTGFLLESVALTLCLMFINDESFIEFINFKPAPYVEYTLAILLLGIAGGLFCYIWEVYNWIKRYKQNPNRIPVNLNNKWPKSAINNHDRCIGIQRSLH